MIPLTVTDACCALFVSGLQRADQPSGDAVVAAISAALEQFGRCGCAALMAQEFGDHPEVASDRMRWASQLASELPLTS